MVGGERDGATVVYGRPSEPRAVFDLRQGTTYLFPRPPRRAGLTHPGGRTDANQLPDKGREGPAAFKRDFSKVRSGLGRDLAYGPRIQEC